jgi:hypothetical protein
MQIAVRDSVTVSIAAEMMGIFKEIFFVNFVEVSTSRGKMLEAEGTRRRSSNVKDSFTTSSSIIPSIII